MSVQNATAQLVQIEVPGTTAAITAAEIDGRPMVSLRHACDALGIAFDAQRVKLQGKSWACVTMTVTYDSSGRRQEMAMIDRRTFTMWLATIDENRVSETARPAVTAFQAEAADALDAYFHDGGAINPSATEDQLDRIARQAGAQAAVIQALKGIVDPKHLEAKGRIVLARALGEEPEIAPADVPLYVSDYLKSKGLASDMIAAKASGFGKRLKGLYVSEYLEEPKKAYQNLPNGTVRPVFAYTEADRPLFDRVWIGHYAGVTKAVSA